MAMMLIFSRLSTVLALCNHFCWFYFFTSYYLPFSQVLSFFMICVWLIPFAFFISMSGESALPSTAGVMTSTGEREPSKKRMPWLLWLFSWFRTSTEHYFPDMVGQHTSFRNKLG